MDLLRNRDLATLLVLAGLGAASHARAQAPPEVALQTLATGLAQPTAIANSGDARLFLTLQHGEIVVFENGRVLPTPFLDIRSLVSCCGERGLLGLTFHPRYSENGFFFVDYTNVSGDTVIARYRVGGGDPDAADAASGVTLLTIPQPFANHNGGQLAFGPDGFLYIGMGDGGSGGDPFGNGQNTRALLGKLLRIDVNGQPAAGKAYAIPRDNPFAAGGIRPGAGAPEVWSYGLRNPWRFSFDAANGDVYIGDVGQGAWEEIDRQAGDSRGGENYGWNVMEGDHCFRDGCNARPFVKPIAEYGHDQGCAVIGGYVYRGSEQPVLRGVYVLADDCSGLVFTLQVDAGTRAAKLLLDSHRAISSFGIGENGEMYAADLGGAISRVVAA